MFVSIISSTALSKLSVDTGPLPAKMVVQLGYLSRTNDILKFLAVFLSPSRKILSYFLWKLLCTNNCIVRCFCPEMLTESLNKRQYLLVDDIRLQDSVADHFLVNISGSAARPSVHFLKVILFTISPLLWTSVSHSVSSFILSCCLCVFHDWLKKN
jgi:hypothetical protein